jgi:hypothetical protein
LLPSTYFPSAKGLLNCFDASMLVDDPDDGSDDTDGVGNAGDAIGASLVTGILDAGANEL